MDDYGISTENTGTQSAGIKSVEMAAVHAVEQDITYLSDFAALQQGKTGALGKTLDEHFELFCLVLERGFALHTGSSNRLVVDFELRDTNSYRSLPRIRPRGGMSFVLPESWLKPSDFYLYYDPSDDADFPQLACYCAENSQFVPADWSDMLGVNRLHQGVTLPVAKLATLKGIHYLKDIACLQLFELDFDRIYDSNPGLAERLRGVLKDKLAEHVQASKPWLSASRSEEVALRYLKNS